MATTTTRDSLFIFISILLVITLFDQTESAHFLPVAKDPSTLQYTTVIYQRTPFVPVNLTVNLGAGLSWVNCDCEYDGCYDSSSYRPVPCGSTLCKHARSGSCTISCLDPPGPNCHNDTCIQLAPNPFIGQSYAEEMATDDAVLWFANGTDPAYLVDFPRDFVFVCGKSSLLVGLPTNSNGIVGLGRSLVSLPAVLSDGFEVPNIFAICLNSCPRSNGVIVFGDGPYFPHSGSLYLKYTPLLLNPVSTAGVNHLGEPSADYFINVTGFQVDGLKVPLNSNLLEISREGYGGTKLSTIDPYMVMETSIFEAVAKTFVYLGSYLNRVDAVTPFEYCFQGVESTDIGPVVPVIDLVLENGNYWTIIGANSMVCINEDVMCLGIINGGTNPVTSIVIGGHQLEETLVQIDMAKKRLGFTSSLRFTNYACADLNLITE